MNFLIYIPGTAEIGESRRNQRWTIWTKCQQLLPSTGKLGGWVRATQRLKVDEDQVTGSANWPVILIHPPPGIKTSVGLGCLFLPGTRETHLSCSCSLWVLSLSSVFPRSFSRYSVILRQSNEPRTPQFGHVLFPWGALLSEGSSHLKSPYVFSSSSISTITLPKSFILK